MTCDVPIEQMNFSTVFDEMPRDIALVSTLHELHSKTMEMAW
jgi:hypothetical protein